MLSRQLSTPARVFETQKLVPHPTPNSISIVCPSKVRRCSCIAQNLAVLGREIQFVADESDRHVRFTFFAHLSQPPTRARMARVLIVFMLSTAFLFYAAHLCVLAYGVHLCGFC